MAQVAAECAVVGGAVGVFEAACLWRLRPQLTHERCGVVEVAPPDEFFDFGGDGQCEFFVVLGGELEDVAVWVVVIGTEAARCPAAYCEVGADEQPEADVWRRSREDACFLVVGGGDVARTQSWVALYLLIELRRTVVFP